jgi:hypothetical protein
MRSDCTHQTCHAVLCSDAAHLLTLELPVPIDTVQLQASISIDLLDAVEGGAADTFAAAVAASGQAGGAAVDAAAAAAAAAASRATSGIISHTTVPPDLAASGVALLATVRCQESTNRVQIRLRTIEGQAGEIQVRSRPALMPGLFASLRRLTALSDHPLRTTIS